MSGTFLVTRPDPWLGDYVSAGDPTFRIEIREDRWTVYAGGGRASGPFGLSLRTVDRLALKVGDQTILHDENRVLTLGERVFDVRPSGGYAVFETGRIVVNAYPAWRNEDLDDDIFRIVETDEPDPATATLLAAFGLVSLDSDDLLP